MDLKSFASKFASFYSWEPVPLS